MRTLAVMLSVFLVFQSSAAVSLAADGSGTLDEELLFLEEEFTVESASRYSQKVTDAPASVTIVTREEISRYGYRTLAELLEGVAGFSVIDDRSYEYIGVRGFGLPADWNSRVLLLLDGHRINEPVYGSAVYGWGLGVDLGNLSKVEIVRGPASALYGTNAMFAVVNLVTMKPDREPGEELELTLSDPGITRVTGRIRRGGSKVDYSLDAYVYDRGGHPVLEYPEFTDPEVVDDDGDGNPDYASGFTKGTDEGKAYGARARVEAGPVTLTAFVSKWTKEVPTAQYFTVFDTDRDFIEEERGFLEAIYRGGGKSDFSWLGKISLDQYRYRGEYTYDFDYSYSDPGFTDPPYTANTDDQSAVWTNFEFQGDYSGISSNRLVFGAEYSLIDTDIENFDDDPFYEYTDLEESTWSMSAYVQDEILLSSSARLVLGVNHTVYDDSVYQGDVDRTNPRLGAVFGIGPGSRIKALYGEALRVPNLYEMLYDDGSYLVSNPDLGPEVMRTAELVFEHELSEDIDVEASVYRNVIEDLIQLEEISGDRFRYGNVSDNVISQGVEFGIRKGAATGFSGFASLALQRTETEDGGEEFPNSPRELANVGISIPLSPGLSYLSLAAHYTGERKSADLSEEIDACTTVNATLTHRAIGPGIEMSASVRNLFDENYSDPGSLDHVMTEIPQDGRTFSLRVKYRF